MPHPPSYTGGQDDDRTRSIDLVHIEPSIREGVHLISSLYGSDASTPLFRFPPINTAAPYITGSGRVPGQLRCIPGSWNASPAANFSFQWMLDGVDVPGETDEFFNTTIPMDGQVATCEVRGFNNQGEDYAVTPVGVPLSIIDPIETFDWDVNVIQGLSQAQELVVQERVTSIVQGVSALGTVSLMGSPAYFLTGVSADTRHDINGMNLNAVTGLQREEAIDVLDAPHIGVVNYYEAFPLVSGVPQPMPLKNNEAEMGNEAWVIDGIIRFDDQQTAFENNNSWHGGDFIDANNANQPYSSMYQDVPVWPVWHTDIDTGNCFLELNWRSRIQFNEDDQANVRVEFFDSNMLSLGSADPSGLWQSPGGIWWYNEYLNIPVPANTRFVRYTVEFLNISSRDSNAFVDSIGSRIRLGPVITGRDVGPDFTRWRLRFLQSNTYSGIGLSEIEFRATPGGADLATGGTVLFGSEGNGGQAVQAFDDARNAGFWAGEIGGVVNGTSWIGYDMGTPVRPQEIDITARQGSNSLQMATEMILEASDANENWTPIQLYQEIPEFASLEQKQFAVLSGQQPWKWDGTENTDIRNSTTSMNNSFKGEIYQAYTRMAITHVAGQFDQAGSYQIVIIKPRWVGYWTVDELIHTENVTVTNTGDVWERFTLSSPQFDRNVYEYFCIGFTFVGALPANGVPIRYHHDTNNGAVDINPYPTARRVASVRKDDEVFDRGQAFTSASAWAMDFRAEIF